MGNVSLFPKIRENVKKNEQNTLKILSHLLQSEITSDFHLIAPPEKYSREQGPILHRSLQFVTQVAHLNIRASCYTMTQSLRRTRQVV